MFAGVLLVIYVPMVLVAWIKVGPIAGIVAILLFVGVAYIRSQPGGQLFGSGPYARSRRE